MNNPDLNDDDELTQFESEEQLNLTQQSNFQPDFIAQMAGNVDEDERQFVPAIDDVQEVEPSQVITQGNTWLTAGLKTLIVGVPILLVVSTVAFSGQFISSFFSGNKDKPKLTAQKIQPMQTSKEDYIKQLEIDAAIGTQIPEINALNNALNLSKTTPVVKPSMAATTKPTSAAGTKTTSKPQPVPVSKVAKRINRTNLASKYEPAPNIKAAQTEKQVIPIFIPISSVPTIPTKPESTRPSTNQVMNPKRPSRSTQTVSATNRDSITNDQSKSTNKTKKNKPKALEIASSIASNNVQTVIVGSRALAELKNTISWRANSTNAENPQVSIGSKSNKSNQYYIRLTQNLENSDGTTVLPKGTLLIVQLKLVTKQGWVNLSVTSIITRTESGVIEKPVPLGAISVQKKDGSPLKAEVGTITQSENINDTNTSTGASRLSRLPVRHGIDPIHNESVRRLDESLQSNVKNQSPNVQIRKFSLEKGSSVQVYVDRSFSL